MRYQLSQAGGTIESVDIIGVSETGKMLYAQVTSAKEIRYNEKREDLKNFIKDKDVTALIFSNESNPKDNKIIDISLMQVWRDLSKKTINKKKVYREMLEMMIGYKFELSNNPIT